ncbi:MAG: thioredoxin domain-containing protein [Bacteroidota bacterium]
MGNQTAELLVFQVILTFNHVTMTFRMIVVLLLVAGISHTAFAQSETVIPEPNVYVVKFHADWCGSCRALGPVLEDLTNKLDGKPVLFVELDFTNQTTRHQANLLASGLGIGKHVAESGYSTGYILVIDPDTKEVKKKLTKDLSMKQMAAAIQTYL